MTDSEEVLLLMLQQTPETNEFAVLLQSYIAEMGPLSEQAGTKVRELLKARAALEPMP